MIGSIIFLIILAVIIYLILKFIKKVISIVLSFIVLLILISSMFLFLVYTDYRDFRTGAAEKNSVLLVSDGPNYVAGGYINITGSETFNTAIPIEDINSVNNMTYSEILGDNYKLFIIDLSFYEKNLPQTPNYDSYTIPKNGILNTIRSQDPKQEYASLINIPKGAITQGPNELKFKLALGSLGSILKDKGKIIIIQGYKDNEILVYKNTLLFKLAKILPNTYINKYIGN